MHSRVKTFIQKHNAKLAIIAAIIGGLYYALQSWEFAHHLSTIVWDESMYIYKGYLFAIGKHTPYQDFGPWTNHMPLSFLIPGYIQKWFGPGMRAGRYYALACGLLAVVGVWLAAVRLGGRWWGAGVVWAFALNTAWIKMYSQAFALVLVGFFLAWSMAFALGEGRRTWELCLAAFLAGLAGMTRINALPVVGVLVVYIFWQYGKKAGLWAAFCGLLPIVGFHAIYWPEIIKLWAYWLPADILPWLDQFRSPWREVFLPGDFSWWKLGEWASNPDHLAWQGLKFLGQGVRYSFLPLFGVLASLLLWPKRKDWKSEAGFKTAIFLTGTYLLMLAVHLWVSMGGKSCVFSCIVYYMQYFHIIGLLAVVAAASSWKQEIKPWVQVLFVALFILLIIFLEFNLHSNYWDFRKAFDLLEKEWVIPLRWIKIALIVLVLPLLSWGGLKRLGVKAANYGKHTLLVGLAFGCVFGSAQLFGGGFRPLMCGKDVIASHERVGAQLNDLIPPGSQVFWAVKSDMLLLYLPGVEVFTPQLDALFTYLGDEDGDLNQMLRFGWWNEELRELWIGEADYVLIEARFFDYTWMERMASGEFGAFYVTDTAESCRMDGAKVFVLEKGH